MKLWEYSGKMIKIETRWGNTFEGMGDLYTNALDNPDGVECISVWTENGILYEFEESEIASIEAIHAPTIAFAV